MSKSALRLTEKAVRKFETAARKIWQRVSSERQLRRARWGCVDEVQRTRLHKGRVMAAKAAYTVQLLGDKDKSAALDGHDLPPKHLLILARHVRAVSCKLTTLSAAIMSAGLSHSIPLFHYAHVNMKHLQGSWLYDMQMFKMYEQM